MLHVIITNQMTQHEPHTTQIFSEGMNQHLTRWRKTSVRSLLYTKKAVITISSGKEIDTETLMAKAYTFTTKHYPINDLLALDLQDHLDQMAKTGWELVSTQQLINAHYDAIPQIIFFWGKVDGN